MPEPRRLSQLPYVHHLVPFAGGLEREGDLDCVRLDEETFDDLDADGVRFTESALTSVVFAGGRMRRARFNEVWLHTVRWVATELVETGWMDAEIVAGSLAGLEMFSAELRRVTFHNCKLDSVNLRAATLFDVSFVDCLLRDVDFTGARLERVTFPGSTLESVRFATSRMSKVDLRTVAQLGIADGGESLKGATISSPQLMDLAPLFAQALGVTVKDR
ncbi:pentapeptide repeat-containing protein [Streptomyces sp. NPDC004838]